MTDEHYRDLAERLAAAAISHGMGNRSIDYTLKAHIRADGKPIGDYWISLARKVSHDMLESRQRRQFGQNDEDTKEESE